MFNIQFEVYYALDLGNQQLKSRAFRGDVQTHKNENKILIFKSFNEDARGLFQRQQISKRKLLADYRAFGGSRRI